jgi:hypothetical protein
VKNLYLVLVDSFAKQYINYHTVEQKLHSAIETAFAGVFTEKTP